MRLSFLMALAAWIFAAAPVRAGDLECVWREFPAETRALFTHNVNSGEDIRVVLTGGQLTEEVVVGPMQRCGVAESEAVLLGQYITARGLALALRNKMMIDYGLHESQITGLLSYVTPVDRALVVQVTNGEAQPTQETVDRFIRGAEAQGFARTDQAAIRMAVEYIYAQIMVEHLAP